MNKTIKAIAETIIKANGNWNTTDVKALLADLSGEVANTNIGLDFTVNYNGIEYRVIQDDIILDTLASELGSDEYILGFFNAWFLADVLDIDQDVIKAMQKAEAFEAIGKLVISLGKLKALAEAYASADGYGHHFNRYDGEWYDTYRVNGDFFHIFRND